MSAGTIIAATYTGVTVATVGIGYLCKEGGAAFARTWQAEAGITGTVCHTAGKAAEAIGGVLFAGGKGLFLAVSVPVYTLSYTLPKYALCVVLPKIALLAFRHIVRPFVNGMISLADHLQPYLEACFNGIMQGITLVSRILARVEYAIRPVLQLVSNLLNFLHQCRRYIIEKGIESIQFLNTYILSPLLSQLMRVIQPCLSLVGRVSLMAWEQIGSPIAHIVGRVANVITNLVAPVVSTAAFFAGRATVLTLAAAGVAMMATHDVVQGIANAVFSGNVS